VSDLLCGGAGGSAASGGGSASPPATPAASTEAPLLPLASPREGPARRDVFLCPEESLFYSQCVEGLVVSRCAHVHVAAASTRVCAHVAPNCRRARARRTGDAHPHTTTDRCTQTQHTNTTAQPPNTATPCNRPSCPSTIVEFGAGDGSPVISALLKSARAPADMPTVHAYEISPAAAALAAARAGAAGLQDAYVVHNGCFWGGAVREGRPAAQCLIANPPYLPAPGEASSVCVCVCVCVGGGVCVWGGCSCGCSCGVSEDARHGTLQGLLMHATAQCLPSHHPRPQPHAHQTHHTPHTHTHNTRQTRQMPPSCSCRGCGAARTAPTSRARSCLPALAP
jgi:hypothetical protein